jgi:hypothetical protein
VAGGLTLQEDTTCTSQGFNRPQGTMLITTRLTTMIINHTQMAAVHQSSKENDQNFTEFRWSLVQCAHLEKYEFVNRKDDIPCMKWKIAKMFETTNQ